MGFVDNFLNEITMYRLVLYHLIVLIVVAIVFTYLKILPFNPTDLILSTTFILIVCYLVNSVFAKTFKAPTNVESVYITALILALIITPANSVHNLVFLGWASVWAMASKYILAIGKKHIFNPAAVAVVITAYGIGNSASWWVGNLPMLPFVLIGGLLITKKIRRVSLLVSFLTAALIVIIGSTILASGNLLQTLKNAFFISPLIFFATVMLTEPLTTPPTKTLQTVYGVLVGILFAPQFHVGTLYTTPEISLLIGNLFAFLVSSKRKLILSISEKIRLSTDIYEFVFPLKNKFAFNPGQYMEWTVPADKADSRGNRRYFTIASSPTENDLKIGVKFYPNSSSFKRSLYGLNPASQISAASLAGDFTLPKNRSTKLVFIAGGIGITPFRSMLKYLVDKNEARDIVLFYATKTQNEIVYKNILDEASQKIGAKIIYVLSDTGQIPSAWTGKTGYVTNQMVTENVPDYKSRHFYISGPQKMVDTFKSTLRTIDIPKNQIKTDYFPGF